MTQEERELRETNERAFQELCHSLRVEGLREGKTEGLREGKSEGLRIAVRNLCEVLDIPLAVEHEQIIVSLPPEGLEALLFRLSVIVAGSR